MTLGPFCQATSLMRLCDSSRHLSTDLAHH
jgi:hypothetical protein